MDKMFLITGNLAARVIVILTVCALLCATSIQPVQADAAPAPDPDVGGIAPYQPIETKVQMMSDAVLIDIPPNPTRWSHNLDAHHTLRSAFRKYYDNGSYFFARLLYPLCIQFDLC
jgi:hypothetical protein